jgi:regulatory protein YycH of two-component signal transduction system YycFG
MSEFTFAMRKFITEGKVTVEDLFDAVNLIEYKINRRRLVSELLAKLEKMPMDSWVYFKHDYNDNIVDVSDPLTSAELVEKSVMCKHYTVVNAIMEVKNI